MSVPDRRTIGERRALPRGGRRVGDHVSIGYLADMWDVHPNTIYRDIRKGALPARKMPGGQYRVLLADAQRYGRPIE